jgi:hypothetical protein
MGWLTAIAITLALWVGPAHADCTRSEMPATCHWEEQIAVEEWLSQQQADAEARVRAWQLFGPQPSPARIEQVRQWLGEKR